MSEELYYIDCDISHKRYYYNISYFDIIGELDKLLSKDEVCSTEEGRGMVG